MQEEYDLLRDNSLLLWLCGFCSAEASEWSSRFWKSVWLHSLSFATGPRLASVSTLGCLYLKVSQLTVY